MKPCTCRYPCAHKHILQNLFISAENENKFLTKRHCSFTMILLKAEPRWSSPWPRKILDLNQSSCWLSVTSLKWFSYGRASGWIWTAKQKHSFGYRDFLSGAHIGILHQISNVNFSRNKFILRTESMPQMMHIVKSGWSALKMLFQKNAILKAYHQLLPSNTLSVLFHPIIRAYIKGFSL